ncbi:uncharacterized protein [Halyomorpha halys]|uniref:uncharacterized protein isoform X2 n=1 Tax=Halyomorpha halys TaxID=286706 RepID=UPI0006D4F7AF|nr:uncharacterized protein LOC106690432 isoform X2 [Halyomorpha halys]
MDIDSLRENPAYAPVGIILGAFAWFALKKVSESIPCVDAAQLRKTLLALIFSGAYIYIWIQGSNPHDAEIKDSTLADEIPLLLAGGYYVLHIYPQRFLSTSAHHFVCIIAIICVIIEQKGASCANTFGFLDEAPNVFFALRGCIAKLEVCALDFILNVIYPLVFILAKFVALGYHTYLILNQDAAIHLQVMAVILALFSLAFVLEIGYLAYKGDEENKKVRSKSKSKSKSRSRSRSKSKSRKSRCCRR